LSLSTGNVSPQYHVQFDDLFETVAKENAQYLPRSEWQYKTHFVKKGYRVSRDINEEVSEQLTEQPLPAANEQSTDNYQTQARNIADNLPQEPEYGQPPPEHVDPLPQPQVELEPPMQETVEPGQVPQPLRRSGRERRQPAHFADYVPHQQIAFEALMEPSPDSGPVELRAMLASSDPDVMYLWQAMKEPDWP
jgi:hypothetical protein